MKDEREGSLILEAGDMARVQKNQLFRAEEQMGQFHRTLDAMSEQGAAQDQALEEMMAWMRAEQNGLEPAESAAVTPYEAQEVQADIQMTRLVPLLKEDSWEEYLASAQWYARLEQLDLSTDPYVSLLSKKEQEDFIAQVREDYYERKAHCDATDYALSAFCGTVAGLIDIFLVGTPEKSVLGKWTDEKADELIVKVSQKMWDMDQTKRKEILDFAKQNKLSFEERSQMLKAAGIPYNQNLSKRPDSDNPNTRLQQCIQYLEKKFSVNYDASHQSMLNLSGATQKELDAIQGLSPSNHHFRSLAHHPDLVGLLFSILDQFTGKTTFISNGSFVRLVPVKKSQSIDEFELRGSNFIAKIICGFINWVGHCLSDLAGSNTTRSEPGKRGMGLPLPGVSLFQFLSLGKFSIGQDLANLTEKMFESGYDFRFGMAMSIPVAVNETMTRLCFALKRYYYHHLPLNECIPADLKGRGNRQPELRRMLLVAHGTMCVWDAGDAAVAYVTTQNPLDAALHLNYFAYIRLAQAGLSELRAMYRQNHIDLQAITEDTQEEWDRLYLEGQKWAPAALPE